MEPYLHYPTLLDWIEHGLAFIGSGWIGWWLHGKYWARRFRKAVESDQRTRRI